MTRRLTLQILLGMLVGLAVGSICRELAVDAAQAKQIASWFDVISSVFLRLIKMIVAPLVFATLVTGIAHMGDTKTLGRIGLKTMLWFLTASLISLSIGLAVVNLLEPGTGLNLPLPEVAAKVANASSGPPSFAQFIIHTAPESMVGAMASNAILQIVVFSIFVGVGLAALGPKGASLVRAIDALAELMLVITGYVMRLAPVAVFSAIAGVITSQGIGVVGTLGVFIGQFYFGLLLLWLVLLAACFATIGPRAPALLRATREPLLLAFSTASSEAAYPKLLDRLMRFGIPKRIASFVLPLGYTFNLDGSMMYSTFAILFIAQAYGIELTLGDQLLILLVLMVTSKGVAGVPRASLVVVAATLAHFDLPEAGLLLILGVDQFLDMGRSATNVIGNAVASAAVARWEGVLGHQEDSLEDFDARHRDENGPPQEDADVGPGAAAPELSR